MYQPRVLAQGGYTFQLQINSLFNTGYVGCSLLGYIRSTDNRSRTCGFGSQQAQKRVECIRVNRNVAPPPNERKVSAERGRASSDPSQRFWAGGDIHSGCRAQPCPRPRCPRETRARRPENVSGFQFEFRRLNGLSVSRQRLAGMRLGCRRDVFTARARRWVATVCCRACTYGGGPSSS